MVILRLGIEVMDGLIRRVNTYRTDCIVISAAKVEGARRYAARCATQSTSMLQLSVTSECFQSEVKTQSYCNKVQGRIKRVSVIVYFRLLCASW
jgi:hypothetical protein